MFSLVFSFNLETTWVVFTWEHKTISNFHRTALRKELVRKDHHAKNDLLWKTPVVGNFFWSNKLGSLKTFLIWNNYELSWFNYRGESIKATENDLQWCSLHNLGFRLQFVLPRPFQLLLLHPSFKEEPVDSVEHSSRLCPHCNGQCHGEMEQVLLW